jgi:hypothetical protein
MVGGSYLLRTLAFGLMQFVIHCLATRAAPNAVLHMLAIRMATSIDQARLCIESVVPWAVAINHPDSGIQPLTELGTVPLRSVNPGDSTIRAVPTSLDNHLHLYAQP